MNAYENLGHIDVVQLRQAIKNGCIAGINIDGSDEYCTTCAACKSTRKLPSKIEIERKATILELIHTDIAGPFSCRIIVMEIPIVHL